MVIDSTEFQILHTFLIFGKFLITFRYISTNHSLNFTKIGQSIFYYFEVQNRTTGGFISEHGIFYKCNVSECIYPRRLLISKLNGGRVHIHILNEYNSESGIFNNINISDSLNISSKVSGGRSAGSHTHAFKDLCFKISYLNQ